MPRLPPRLLRAAARRDPLLPLLLPTTRTIPQSLCELRWLRAHAASHPSAPPLPTLCRLRGRLRIPLQHILGTQPFGRLDIVCRRNVLIPRAETEELALHLALLLRRRLRVAPHPPLRILDLCTGSGCIALALASEVPGVFVAAVDASPAAVAAAEHNLARHREVLAQGSDVEVLRGDVFARGLVEVLRGKGRWDVLVSNPPYIAPREYVRETELSVRRWEPRMALVAGEGGDGFYGRIIEVAEELGVGAVVVETGAGEQAGRVREGWARRGWRTGVWRDFRGRERTVVAWREGWEGLGEGPPQFAG